MTKKIAVASIVALVIGGVAIPGGIAVNDMILGMVQDFVSDGFLGVEEEAVPMIEPMLNDMAIPTALRGIRDMGLDMVEEMVKDTFSAFLIDTIMKGFEMDLVIIHIAEPAASYAQFFNSTTYIFAVNVLGTDLISVQGAGNYLNQSLNITSEAAEMIIYGNHTDNNTHPFYVPGLLQDLDMGSGVADFLALYDEAKNDTTPEAAEMMAKYSCTWEQLTSFVDYLRDYIREKAIPDVIAGADIQILFWTLHVDIVGMLMPDLAGVTSTFDIAEIYFYNQWSNCSLIPDGMDFSELLDDVDDPLYGFEVGRHLINTSHTPIPFEVAKELFNEGNTKALASDDGINFWLDAKDDIDIQDELIEWFGLTIPQMDAILYWLFNESFRDDIVPELMKLPVPDGVGMNLTEYSRVLLLEVWSNGTAVGRPLYPYGFPFPLGEKTVYGFEIGYQSQKIPVISSEMPLHCAEALWDPENENSLTNKGGLAKWWQAVGNPDSAVADELQAAIGLSDKTMGMLLEYLPKFRDNVMPHLAQYVMGLPVDTTTLGTMIQIGGISIGAILIALASTGLINNRYRKVSARNRALGPQRVGYPNQKKVLPPSAQYKRVWNKKLEQYEYKKK